MGLAQQFQLPHQPHCVAPRAIALRGANALQSPFTEHAEAIARLAAMCSPFTSPELIDDGEQTAPSKRIIRELPEYESRKAAAGSLIAAKIGLPVLRQKCLHFDEWLKKLEALA